MYTAMHSFQRGTPYIGRVSYGEDIHTALEAFCEVNQITSAWLTFLGALSEATLAYYTQDTHQYVTQTFRGDYEILNGTGNISMKDSRPFAHIHLTLSDTQFNCRGGHLMRDSVKVFACEFMLIALQGEASLLRCTLDQQTGLPLWT